MGVWTALILASHLLLNLSLRVEAQALDRSVWFPRRQEAPLSGSHYQALSQLGHTWEQSEGLGAIKHLKSHKVYARALLRSHAHLFKVTRVGAAATWRHIVRWGEFISCRDKWNTFTQPFISAHSGLRTPDVYDLLTSPDCLPDLLQGGLVEQGVNEAFILTSFKLQPKTGTSIFALFNPRDNSKYFEFTVMGKLNRAVLRYLRSDKRMTSVTFNNLVLADGQQHRLLFHLKGMQQGPGGVELHLDCRLVETIRDLPAAFQGLPAEYGTVDLKTMQARDQESLDELKLVVGDTFENVASIQDCHFQQKDSVQTLGVNTKQLSNQMLDLTKVINELKDVLIQQVKETSFLRNTISECQACGLGGTEVVKPRCGAGVCFRDVRCIETADGVECGPCPDGYTGDGFNCDDVDECQFNPCFPGVKCVNTAPGFRCDACPLGFSGLAIEGVGVIYAQTNKQVCDDVDECKATNNGGCAANSACQNSVGSYHCGSCKTGFSGDQVKGCKPEVSCGNSLTNPCDLNALCTMERDGTATCECGIGWAGNGYLCGKDTDIDGYPDDKLKCKDSSCKKDNCPLKRNVDQRNSDKDSHGDACDNCRIVENPDQRDTDSDGRGTPVTTTWTETA
ncbi:hypothetical protein KUCAC02_031524 [Chaenocephalus aceratus]|nr:hypothetical protein KUCAC02_031524 [Chaenocephalus aceratus]